MQIQTFHFSIVSFIIFMYAYVTIARRLLLGPGAQQVLPTDLAMAAFEFGCQGRRREGLREELAFILFD